MELVFTIGGGLRKVFIFGRKISFLSAETNYTPFEIDLDKLEDKENKHKLKQMKADKNFLNELSKLQTEEEIAKDIIKDFQKSGWRLMKKNA
jgi:predicted  nucleic acid-binding Zn-ribbon protein